uniref:Uncharacterized protein n=1 Tax=Setaria viridis TaxID=4556 RepID=A0A4U6UKI2_SETVI|nr:hypothetical protein SEVIR_5G249000v2 [Setaria viridis]
MQGSQICVPRLVRRLQICCRLFVRVQHCLGACRPRSV